MDATQLSQSAASADAASGRARMQAIVQHRYGTRPNNVLGLERVAMPAIAANEVLVQVRAAGVDRGTWHLMAGQPYLMRLLGFGLRGPKNPVPGLDVAGTVAATGAGVTGFRAGEEVFGIARGSFAEYAAARADKLVHKPARLSFEQAAAVAVSGLAALQGLRAGRIHAGQQVLVIGASGGVGSYAVQLAKAFGAEVTGVCSTGKADVVRSIGADHVIDYTAEDFADGRQHYDLILDIGGNSRLARLRGALAPTGTLVIAGGEGAKWTGIIRQLRALMLSPFVRQRLTAYISTHRQADLDTLRQLTGTGQVTPIIGRTYPLPGVPQAIRDLQAGHARGRSPGACTNRGPACPHVNAPRPAKRIQQRQTAPTWRRAHRKTSHAATQNFQVGPRQTNGQQSRSARLSAARARFRRAIVHPSWALSPASHGRWWSWLARTRNSFPRDRPSSRGRGCHPAVSTFGPAGRSGCRLGGEPDGAGRGLAAVVPAPRRRGDRRGHAVLPGCPDRRRGRW